MKHRNHQEPEGMLHRNPSHQHVWTRARAVVAVAAAAALTAGWMICEAPPVKALDCADIDAPVARGTQEPGTLGAEIGDPLIAMLRDALPQRIDAYRVDYPADLLIADSIGDGSADLVAHITTVASACPATRFVVIGYSQGAAVVHTALGPGLTDLLPGATRLPDGLADRIVAVLLFGDPLRLIGQELPDPYRSRLGSWCTEGDPVCQPGGAQPAQHIAYAGQLDAAVSFVAHRL